MFDPRNLAIALMLLLGFVLLGMKPARAEPQWHWDDAFDAQEQAFLDDWTEPHEFAHLLLPYLGREEVARLR